MVIYSDIKEVNSDRLFRRAYNWYNRRFMGRKFKIRLQLIPVDDVEIKDDVKLFEKVPRRHLHSDESSHPKKEPIVKKVRIRKKRKRVGKSNKYTEDLRMDMLKEDERLNFEDVNGVATEVVEVIEEAYQLDNEIYDNCEIEVLNTEKVSPFVVITDFPKENICVGMTEIKSAILVFDHSIVLDHHNITQHLEMANDLLFRKDSLIRKLEDVITEKDEIIKECKKFIDGIVIKNDGVVKSLNYIDAETILRAKIEVELQKSSGSANRFDFDYGTDDDDDSDENSDHG